MTKKIKLHFHINTHLILIPPPSLKDNEPCISVFSPAVENVSHVDFWDILQIDGRRVDGSSETLEGVVVVPNDTPVQPRQVEQNPFGAGILHRK